MSVHGRLSIGIDVGTSAVKAVALAESGMTLSRTSVPYPTSTLFPGAAEQDPEDWWRATLDTLREIVVALGERGIRPSPDDTIVSLTGQMHTSVLLDEGGSVLRPALLWSDKRALEQCRRIEERVPDYAAITGNPAMPALTVAHLLWLRDHEPDLVERVSLVLNPKDEIRRRLCGVVATEPSDASGTGLLDTQTGDWSDALLSSLGIPRRLVPSVVGSHERTGSVRATASLAANDPLHALTDVPVVSGGGDQATQAVALGVTEPGRLGLSLGTSGVAFTSVTSPRLGAFRHAYDDLWLALDSTHAAGLALSWLAALVRTPIGDLAEHSSGPEDAPVFLPYLQGHRGSAGGAPGAFVGLSARHTPADLAYAVMEGVAFELRRLAVGIGGDVDGTAVVVGGGGARSLRWRTILANAFGRDVRYTDRGSAYGAAVIGAEAAGWANAVPDPTDAHETASPEASGQVVLDERSALFRRYAERLA